MKEQPEKKKGHRKEKFLEICLLALLREEPIHGYKLLEMLKKFGYEADEVDVSTLYRTLRRLEENGQVHSVWEDSDQGPNKRIYNITEAGLLVLGSHIEHMKSRIHFMNLLIQYFEEGNQR